ncbi:MAG: biotin synthase BioB [Bacillota bacterium]
MLKQIEQRLLAGENITRDMAEGLSNLKGMEVLELISISNRVTRQFRGAEMELCSIINARSGSCSEDCSFCAQSSRFATGSDSYPMISPGKALKHAAAMERAGAKRFSLVTSGRGISDRDFEKALVIFALLKRETGLRLCASFGIIDDNKALALKKAGVTMYHHNLETPRQFFPQICSTHTYDDRIKTISSAKKAGLRVCSGGIAGLGETLRQRIDLAFEIRDLGVDSVPVNFLTPIRGTPLENKSPLPPLELLHTLAIFRLVLPKAQIRLCGGRSNLRSLQPLAFMAGADGVMIGNYLTTKGEDLQNDLRMLSDLGFLQSAKEGASI